MRKLTFEVLRNDNPRASASLEAYMLRYEEDGKVREFILPEYDSTLCDTERTLKRKLQELLKDSL